MSAEDARRFIDLVDSDPQLQEEVKTNRGNLVDLAAQKGLTVTEEEVQDELHDRWGTGDTEGGPEAPSYTIGLP